MKKIILSVLLVICVVGCTGCAFTNVNISRDDYESIEKERSDASKFKIFLKVIGGEGEFEDEVTVGVKKNGYGWDTAKVFIKPTLQEWVSYNLAEEFKKAVFASFLFPR